MTEINLTTTENFIDFVTSNYREKHYWELRLIGKDGKVKSNFFDNGNSVKNFISDNQDMFENFNCYIGINPRAEKTRGDDSVKVTNLLFVDLDNSEAIKDANKIYANLSNNFSLRPSLVCNSGHGVHIYWKLENVIDSKKWTELQEELILFFKRNFKEYNADEKIKNPERIMRLIGSVNIKDEPIKTSILIEDYTTYRLSEIEEVLNHYKQKEERTVKIEKPLTKELKEEQIDFLVKRLNPFWIKGHRNALTLSITGFLMKNGYGIDNIKKLIEKVCVAANDEELNSRINTVESHDKFKDLKDLSQLIGSTGLYKEFLDVLGIKDDAVAAFSEIKNIIKDRSKEKLEFLTLHMPDFDDLDRITRIHGSEYKVIKKALWYHLHSIPFRQVKIQLGDVETDCRVHIALPLPSGAGKRNFIGTIEKTSNRLNLRCAKPTSFHPEQLIGKVIRHKQRRGEEPFEQIKGWLSEPVVIFEEAIDLLRSTEPTYRESRKYVITALDPYGLNELVKKMVDTPIEEALRYMPDCVCSMFFQPYVLDEEVVLIGLLRRFIIPYVRVKEKFEVMNYEQRTVGNNDIIDYVERFSQGLNTLDIDSIVFKPESIQRLLKLHLELLKLGATYSEKGMNYTRIMDYDLQDKLIKLSAIQALSRGRTEIEVGDVELAFMDLFEFFKCTLNFVENKINGYLDYGEGWGGAVKKDVVVLRWLKEQNATSLENSNVTIDDFVNKIAEIYDIGLEGARKKYYKFKESEWIDSKQLFQGNTKVWLKIQGGQGHQGGNPLDMSSLQSGDSEYFKIVEKLRSGSFTTFTTLNKGHWKVMDKKEVK
jgi:hypothetical protein